MPTPDDHARTRSKARALRQTRAARRPLTLTDIVAAATALADASGIQAVSMARVAQSLRHSTMSLYRHVDTKEQLIRLMQDGVWDAVQPRATGTWRDRARSWTVDQISVYELHPWLLELPISRPDMPGQLKLIDAGLACLDQTALPAAEKLTVLMLLSATARTLVSAAHDLDGSDLTQAISETAAEHGLGHITTAITQGAFDDDHLDVIDYSISRLLDGIETRIPES